MKRLITSIGTILITVFLFSIILSCDKNYIPPSFVSEKDIFNPENELDVKLAKAYYYKILLKKEGNVDRVRPIRTDSIKKNKKYPVFGFAYQSANARTTFVEIPIYYNQRGTFIYTNEQLSQEIKKEIFKGSLERLLIYKDKITGKIDQRIITYVPEINYLRKNENDISHNTIDQLDSEFTGFIEYRKWDGTRLYVLTIEDGLVVDRQSLVEKSTKGSKNSSKIKGTVCYNQCTDWYQVSCWTSNPETGEQNCAVQYVGESCKENCENTSSPQEPCKTGNCGEGSDNTNSSGQTTPVTTPEPNSAPQLPDKACLSSFKFLKQNFSGPNSNNALTWGKMGILIDRRSGSEVSSATFGLDIMAPDNVQYWDPNEHQWSHEQYGYLYASGDIQHHVNGRGEEFWTFTPYAQEVIARDAADYAGAISNKDFLKPEVAGGKEIYKKEFASYFESYLKTYIPGSRVKTLNTRPPNAQDFKLTLGDGKDC